jgi:hypothetical protein
MQLKKHVRRKTKNFKQRFLSKPREILVVVTAKVAKLVMTKRPKLSADDVSNYTPLVTCDFSVNSLISNKKYSF